MTAILDLMKISAILCNAHKWALREQRPRISGFVDLWKAQYPMRSCSTAKQEATETIPEPRAITTTDTSGLKPPPLRDMESRDKDRLLDVLELYQGLLKDERQERQRLMAQVDEMQKRLLDFIGHQDSSKLPSLPSQPVQPTGSQQSPREKNSTMAKPTLNSHTPQPEPPCTTALNLSPKPNRQLLPLRKKPLTVAKQNIKAPQAPLARPEIFGKGIVVRWASRPGKIIRVRLPKSPPTTSETPTDQTPIKSPVLDLTKTPAPETKVWVFSGQPPAPTRPAPPSKPDEPVRPPGILPVRPEKKEPTSKTPPATSIFSNIQSPSAGAGLFQASPSTTSIFSTAGLKPAAPQDLPGSKFQFTGTPTSPPSKAEQTTRPTSQDVPEFSFAPPLLEEDRSAPASETPSKFNFAAPLPKVKQPAFSFSFAPLPASEKTSALESTPLSNSPADKDKTPAPAPIIFFSPSTATKKNKTTSGSSSAPFWIFPNPEVKTPPSRRSTTAQQGSRPARDDSSTPLWRSPFSSEGEGKESKPENQASPSTRTARSRGPKAETRQAAEQATAHDTPKATPASPEPLLATLPSTPEVEAKRDKRSERSQQPDENDDDVDKEYDAGDEEDEDVEGEASGCVKEEVSVKKSEQGGGE